MNREQRVREQRVQYGMCPESVGGHHNPDRAGRCTWCGRKSHSAMPMPGGLPPAESGQAYRYHFDPDFGSGPWDVYQ